MDSLFDTVYEIRAKLDSYSDIETVEQRQDIDLLLQKIQTVLNPE